MPKKHDSWDVETGQALAQAMAGTYGHSPEVVRDWYLKAVEGLDNLDRAKNAVKALIEEPFVVAEYGYEERDRDAYRAHHWQVLKDALGITESFCDLCGQWYPPGTHTCP